MQWAGAWCKEGVAHCVHECIWLFEGEQVLEAGERERADRAHHDPAQP